MTSCQTLHIMGIGVNIVDAGKTHNVLKGIRHEMENSACFGNISIL
jgi:hypothetical protein